jgi:hypothetical protein
MLAVRLPASRPRFSRTWNDNAPIAIRLVDNIAHRLSILPWAYISPSSYPEEPGSFQYTPRTTLKSLLMMRSTYPTCESLTTRRQAYIVSSFKTINIQRAMTRYSHSKHDCEDRPETRSLSMGRAKTLYYTSILWLLCHQYVL